MARKIAETQEEQPDMLWKTAQFEHELSGSTSVSLMQIPFEYFASGDMHAPSESMLVQMSGHTEHDVEMFASEETLTMDGRINGYTTEALEWTRHVDGEDLARERLIELVENTVAFDAVGEDVKGEHIED